MNELITMTAERLQNVLVFMALFGLAWGYLLGRLHQHGKQINPKQRKPHRTPAQRHTRSHW